jgi:hypothetical protein
VAVAVARTGLELDRTLAAAWKCWARFISVSP